MTRSHRRRNDRCPTPREDTLPAGRHEPTPVPGDPDKPWMPTIQWMTNDGKPPPMPKEERLDEDIVFDRQHRINERALGARHLTLLIMIAGSALLLTGRERLVFCGALLALLLGVGAFVQIMTMSTGRFPRLGPVFDSLVLVSALVFEPNLGINIVFASVTMQALNLVCLGALWSGFGTAVFAAGYPLIMGWKSDPDPKPEVLAILLGFASIPTASYLHGRLRKVERLTRKKYLELLGGLDAVVWEADPETLELTFASPQVREIFGVSPRVFVRTWSDFVHPDDREREVTTRRGAIEAGEREFILEHRMVTFTGESLHVRNKFSVQYDGAGKAKRVRGALLDVTRQQEAEATIRKQAQYDTLTGLPNRSLFNDALKRTLDEARRAGEGVAVLLLDLNGFKEVNDTLGHAVGDHLLQAIAGRLAAYLPERSLVARLGGDEFAVLVSPSNARSAGVIAETIASCLQPPISVDAMTIQAGASTGIALYPGDGDTPASLLRRADAAMYEAKQSGRTHMFATPDDDEANVRRLQLLGELRASISTGDFRLFHQPKIDLRTGAIVGTEGLIRWQHRQFGLLGPGEFVELTELSGLIQPLTRWVIEQGIRDLAEWRKNGYELMVALNLSVRNFFDQGLPSYIAQLLTDYGVPGDQVVLEITESEVMADRALARTALSAFRSLGVKISIDDFGTGFSSLSQLQQLPIDEIKIDQSFVSGMLTNPQDGVIVRSIVDLGHNLGLEVVAEGAEEFAQIAALRDLGADRAQGYVISKPLPGDVLLRWLSTLERRVVHGKRLLIFPAVPLGDSAPGKFGSSAGRSLAHEHDPRPSTDQRSADAAVPAAPSAPSVPAAPAAGASGGPVVGASGGLVMAPGVPVAPVAPAPVPPAPPVVGRHVWHPGAAAPGTLPAAARARSGARAPAQQATPVEVARPAQPAPPAQASPAPWSPPVQVPTARVVPAPAESPVPVAPAAAPGNGFAAAVEPSENHAAPRLAVPVPTALPGRHVEAPGLPGDWRELLAQR